MSLKWEVIEAFGSDSPGIMRFYLKRRRRIEMKNEKGCFCLCTIFIKRGFWVKMVIDKIEFIMQMGLDGWIPLCHLLYLEIVFYIW